MRFDNDFLWVREGGNLKVAQSYLFHRDNLYLFHRDNLYLFFAKTAKVKQSYHLRLRNDSWKENIRFLCFASSVGNKTRIDI